MNILYENECKTFRIILYKDNSLIISVLADQEYIIVIKKVRGNIHISHRLKTLEIP